MLQICSVTSRLIQLQQYNGIKAIPPWKAKLKSWIDGCPVTIWCKLSIVLKVMLVDCVFVILSMLFIVGFIHVLQPIGEERERPLPFQMFWVRLLLNCFSSLSVHKFWPSVLPFVHRYVDYPYVCLAASSLPRRRSQACHAFLPTNVCSTERSLPFAGGQPIIASLPISGKLDFDPTYISTREDCAKSLQSR